jgi:hypothetical protein
MKRFFAALTFCIVSTCSSADTAIEDQINSACQRHAISLSGELQLSIFRDMSEAQAEQVRQKAMISCNSYFQQAFVDNPTAREVAEEKSRAEMIEKETTEERLKRWLSEEPERNAGHKRLQKH